MVTNVITVTPWESVAKAEKIMRRHRIGGMPVLEKEKVVGIITSFDIRMSHPNRLVADAMTKNVHTAPANYSLWQAKRLLEKYNVERLPVVENDRLVGIVTKSMIHSEINKHFDPMTGLRQISFLYEMASFLLKQGRDISLILLDMNNFGEVNKNYGHIFGDAVLIKASQIWASLLPEDGELFRYGGDEFVVLLPQPLDEAKKLAGILAAHPIEVKSATGEKIKVTVSAGIAGGRRSRARQDENLILNIKDLLNLASLASTRAKRDNSLYAVAQNVIFERAIDKKIAGKHASTKVT